MAMSDAIANFEILVRHGALRGRFEIDDFLEAYRAIQPSIHRLCQQKDAVDVEALLYALARLPDRIHRVREVLVQADVPDKLPGMHGIEEVVVPTRRRTTFQIGEDRVVVVAREGVTELLDLITLLSAFAVEAYKIHHLLQQSEVLADVRRYLAGPANPSEHNRLLVRLAFDLGTTDDLLVCLGRRWGEETLARLVAIVEQPPRIVVRLHREYSLQASMHRSCSWARRIAEEVAQRIPGSGPIHILSSNTHSTVNLLSPFPRLHESAIRQWGRAHPKFSAWLDSPHISAANLLYYIMKGWLEAHPDRQSEKAGLEGERGIFEITDMDAVGVTAQIVDMARLDSAAMDPRLALDAEEIRRVRPVLLNFDYAFGEQAGIVVEQLFRHFGQRVASFCILGKAGTLIGSRGGLMLPTYVIREGSRDIYDIPNGNFLTAAALADLQVGEVIDGGPMLTVLGTILQNDELLKAYLEEWKVVGLEMEGIPYLRSLHQCLKLGLVNPLLKVGIGYYASDSPLVPGESLSRALAVEGVDPTYGLNLAILRHLLGTPT